MVLGCASQSWAFGSAIQAVLATGYVASSECTITANVVTTYTDTLAASSLYISNKFSPSENSSVCQIDLNISKHASETSNFIVEIRSDNAGLPSETILATSNTVPSANVTTSLEYVAFVFDTPYSVNSGTVYHFVLRKTGTTTGYNLGLGSGNSASEYVGSSTTGLTGSWTQVSATRTMLYKIYGN